MNKYTLKKAVRCVFAALAAIILISLVACVPAQPVEYELPEGYVPEVKGRLKVGARLNVYPNESSRKSVNNWLNAFRNKYPEVTIEANFSLPDDYSALISSKTIGDVYWLSDADCYNFAITQQALMPLDYYIEAFDIDLSNMYSGILNLCVANGRYYFAGATCGNMTFTYNADAMIEAGLLEPGERVANDWTWEDFKRYAEQLKTYDVDGKTLTQVGMGFPLYWTNCFSSFIYAYGGTWSDTVNKKVMLSNENVRKGVNEAISAIDNRWIYPEGVKMSTEMKASYGDVRMNNGCVFVSTNAYTVLTSSVAELYNQKGIAWDVAPWPLFPEKASPCGTLGFGVFNYTRNRDAAAALVLSLWTEDGQIALHGQEGGDVPVLKKLGDQDFWHLTREGYRDINFDAFTANYDRYVPGQVNACVPPEVASIIEKGIAEMFDDYCTGKASWVDKLAEIESQCNDTWDAISKEN
ncbi:MAG: carbohydrate ABC transporter substrate-binding protein [Clostridia bacterium]|nr:carbohydrate ABC transporter substrate-binding protein [Clostridia bacterium]